MFWKSAPTVSTDKKKIDDLLSRSVAEVIPSKEGLKKELLSGRRLRIYIGTDATGTSLHLGHATNYMILERLRRLGHEVIFLIGDFTSRIGDPTDKSDAARKQLTRDEVVRNTQTWIKQVEPVIDVRSRENPVKILYNDVWLSKLTFEDVINIASHFTVQHMLERDMFEKRLNENKPLYLHELFYPLMQGYDSVAMDVDVEMCGNDQKFNALAGRTLLRRMKDKEKFVFITTLLENPKTGEKMMSKSLGTGVFLDASAEDMYGGIMAQPDENMQQLFVDCTWLELPEIEKILTGRPIDVKKRLAYEITAIYHGKDIAEKAHQNFDNTFSKGGFSEDIKTIEVHGDYSLVDVLLEQGLVSSRGEFNRLEKAGAIKITEVDMTPATPVPTSVPSKATVIRVGKHRFIRILHN
ncbi:MAG: tyrosine--tRNA ligase [Patescibacteria group bacterium]